MEGWTGPLGAPKDFELGLVGVEAKARSPQRGEVRISSVDQLDSAGVSRLFLSVIEVGAAFDDSATAVTVTDVATRVRDRISALTTPRMSARTTGGGKKQSRLLW